MKHIRLSPATLVVLMLASYCVGMALHGGPTGATAIPLDDVNFGGVNRKIASCEQEHNDDDNVDEHVSCLMGHATDILDGCNSSRYVAMNTEDWASTISTETIPLHWVRLCEVKANRLKQASYMLTITHMFASCVKPYIEGSFVETNVHETDAGGVLRVGRYKTQLVSSIKQACNVDDSMLTDMHQKNMILAVPQNKYAIHPAQQQ